MKSFCLKIFIAIAAMIGIGGAALLIIGSMGLFTIDYASYVKDGVDVPKSPLFSCESVDDYFSERQSSKSDRYSKLFAEEECYGEQLPYLYSFGLAGAFSVASFIVSIVAACSSMRTALFAAGFIIATSITLIFNAVGQMIALLGGLSSQWYDCTDLSATDLSSAGINAQLQCITNNPARDGDGATTALKALTLISIFFAGAAMSLVFQLIVLFGCGAHMNATIEDKSDSKSRRSTTGPSGVTYIR